MFTGRNECMIAALCCPLQKNHWQPALWQDFSPIAFSNRVQKNSAFLKSKPLGFLGFLLGLGFYWLQIFYLNEQLGSLLFDLAHQLSFYLDLPIL